MVANFAEYETCKNSGFDSIKEIYKSESYFSYFFSETGCCFPFDLESNSSKAYDILELNLGWNLSFEFRADSMFHVLENLCLSMWNKFCVAGVCDSSSKL